MKRTRPVKKRKTLFIILAGVLIVGAAAGLYFWKHKKPAAENSNIGIAQGNGGSINYNPPGADEKNTSDQQKDDIIKKETEQPSKPDGNLNVTISRANQPAKGDPLQVRTIVSGIDTGTCMVSLSRAGQNTVTKSVTITPDATYVTCNTNIDASEFAVVGEWTLEVTVKSNAATSSAATQKVTISK